MFPQSCWCGQNQLSRCHILIDLLERVLVDQREMIVPEIIQCTVRAPSVAVDRGPWCNMPLNDGYRRLCLACP